MRLVPQWWPPKGSPLQFRLEKWFWAFMTAVVVVVYIKWRWLWDAVSILYLAVVSNHSLVKGCGGQEQAAEAKQAAQETNT